MNNSAASISRLNASVNTRRFVTRYIALMGMIAVVLLMATLRPALLTLDSLQTIVVQASVLCVLAVGLACAMSMKAIDLSVAACADLIGYLVAMMVMAHVPVGVAVVSCLLIAAVIGLFNGVMAGYLGVPAIVATLAMNLLLTTAILVVSNNGTPVQLFTNPDSNVQALRMLGNGYIGPVSVLALIAIVVIIVMWFATTRTSWGRRIDLIESSARAAFLSGVPTRFIFLSGFVVASVIAGIAGILLAGRTGIAVPGNATPMLLQAFTVVYVGAIACPAGRIRILWTAAGAVFVTILANGLTLLGVGAEWRTGLNGALIIGALAISAAKRRRVT